MPLTRIPATVKYQQETQIAKNSELTAPAASAPIDSTLVRMENVPWPTPCARNLTLTTEPVLDVIRDILWVEILAWLELIPMSTVRLSKVIHALVVPMAIISRAINAFRQVHCARPLTHLLVLVLLAILATRFRAETVPSMRPEIKIARNSTLTTPTSANNAIRDLSQLTASAICKIPYARQSTSLMAPVRLAGKVTSFLVITVWSILNPKPPLMQILTAPNSTAHNASNVPADTTTIVEPVNALNLTPSAVPVTCPTETVNPATKATFWTTSTRNVRSPRWSSSQTATTPTNKASANNASKATSSATANALEFPSNARHTTVKPANVCPALRNTSSKTANAYIPACTMKTARGTRMHTAPNAGLGSMLRVINANKLIPIVRCLIIRMEGVRLVVVGGCPRGLIVCDLCYLCLYAC